MPCSCVHVLAPFLEQYLVIMEWIELEGHLVLLPFSE